ncbi:gluconate 2-dehydrogenase subunit 3 family protein [Zobellia sp. 1_MG-2023]|uniref:gluconate 2-dehydrogenase subunit 3 family protein n=1 Tax=Zobellia sp. 1_MG-2023 TaxID=3062626 RepID=UPI0026E2316E|nr:gluconate 2-dehydrogenase subunit 3 family protein [Zobellia sp. 1_MG-2023]MDO6818506.1 gluconate 2-dehydrogenase subunit 3 family protein [Zobellia sp. 1_MG-2023]
MDRRKALMQIGMSMGYVVAAPTFMSVLQSCNYTKTTTWVPQFLNEDQGTVLIGVIDSILPKTDTLSASEVNVHIFLDSFANEVMPPAQRDQFKATLNQLAVNALESTNKENISDLTEADLAPEVLKALTDKKAEGVPFAKKIRDLTIWGYKCTEYVGEEVLAYDSIPGKYIACGDLDELTGGKAWSI